MEEICLEPHFAIREDARKQNTKCIKTIWYVPLPPLFVPEHPVSAVRFDAFLCIAEVKQLYEPDSSRHCTGTNTYTHVASSSSP